MSIGTPVSIGTVQNKTSQSTTVLTTTAAVPAGALIVVCYAVDGDGADSSIIANLGNVDSITDSAGNAYNRAYSRTSGGTNSDVAGGIWYAKNATALPSGSTVTLNWFSTSTPSAKAISALYCAGIDTAAPLDRIGWASSVSTAPSVNTLVETSPGVWDSAATTQADELTVGIVGTEGPSSDTFTQDASPAYGNIPVRVGTSGGSAVSNITLAGGYFIESATGVKTYNPTLGSSRDWAAVIATFKGASAGNSYTGSGGAQSGGVAALVHTVAAPSTGGAVTAGIAALALGVSLLAGGGATTGGAGAVQFASSYRATSGIQTGGAASVLFTIPQPIYDNGSFGSLSFGEKSWGEALPAAAETYIYAAVGGAQTGGAASSIFGPVVQAVGGMQSNGIAVLQFAPVYVPTGGTVTGGIAPLAVDKVLAATGGATTGGVAPYTFNIVFQPSGGVAASGVAVPQIAFNYSPAGGIVTGGEAGIAAIASYLYTSVGGMQFGGISSYELGAVFLSSGGMLTDGAADSIFQFIFNPAGWTEGSATASGWGEDAGASGTWAEAEPSGIVWPV